ncbi:hypothetical protein [Kitasatospora sp. NPDC085464]|uniref:hypothetical protein n=1 Tax=Kitasatospora sp. NPDC085464 TaxID=3364063 RepID=UPI0037C7EC4A
MKALVALLLAAAAGIGAGLITAQVAASHPQSQESSVTTFNDGFSDSKSDDCQQGFQPACDWLAETKPTPGTPRG